MEMECRRTAARHGKGKSALESNRAGKA